MTITVRKYSLPRHDHSHSSGISPLMLVDLGTTEKACQESLSFASGLNSASRGWVQIFD